MSRRVLASTIALAVGAAAVGLLAIGGREPAKGPAEGTPVAASRAASRPSQVPLTPAAPSTPILPAPSPAQEPPSRSLPDEPRKGGRVAGWVVDSEADAIAGARIRVAADPAGGGEDFEPKTLTTDETGAFSLEWLGEGPFILIAKAEGRKTAILRDVRPGAGVFEIVLPRLTGIAGRVLEYGTGAPVKRFTAKLPGPHAVWAPHLGWTGPTRSFESEDGSFEITCLWALPLDLEFGGEGFVPARIEVEALGEGELRGDFEVRLRRGLSVSGRVVDGESGEPVPRAHVYFSLPDEPERIVAAERTGRDGSFTIDGFCPGARLRVRHLEFADATTGALGMAGEPAVTGLVVRLSRGGAIDGYARSADGSPYAGGEARIWLDHSFSDTGVPFRKTAPIARSGYFAIRGLAPGEYRVTAGPARRMSMPSDPSSPELTAYAPVEDGKTTRVEFTPPPAG